MIQRAEANSGNVDAIPTTPASESEINFHKASFSGQICYWSSQGHFNCMQRDTTIYRLEYIQLGKKEKKKKF